MLTKIMLIIGIASSIYIIVSSGINIIIRQVNKHIDDKLDRKAHI
jgi:hypothetical protein